MFPQGSVRFNSIYDDITLPVSRQAKVLIDIFQAPLNNTVLTNTNPNASK